MSTPPQFISPGQWQAVKNTVSALDGSEANDGELPDWWGEFRDQLNKLLICASPPVEPFEVSQHFLWLLDQYVEGSKGQEELGTGTKLALEWATATLEQAATLGLHPVQGGTNSVWVVMESFGPE